MNTLIKNVQVNDPASAHHGKVLDVYIQDGRYHSIGKSLKEGKGDQVVDGTNCVFSPGWFDMRVSFKEPGDEQKETIRSGQDAAAAGGFTGVLLMPSTHPPLQTNADISFVKRQAANHLVDVIPAGVLTDNRDGNELSGMYDMQLAGAKAFTDDKRSINNSGVMLRAIQYAANIGATVIAYTDDPGLTDNLQANESPATTVLGFKGMPSIAEEISVQRNLSLVAYSGHPIHLSGISTKEAVEIIREAKKNKLPVTAEVYVYHLALEDGTLETFDSIYKVKPPLRSADDLKALQKAVIDGTIDVVCSDHCPEDTESKDVEFDYAAFGMIGLESFYGVLNTTLKGKLTNDRIYELLVKSPREILKMDIPSIKENELANFTLYDPKQEWVFEKSNLKSLSTNTPFLGKKLVGKVLMTGNNSQLNFCN
ncbi:MAG: dihydroorotase [Bacteroidetes bacterium]|nr:dihydroorotase [Bacteroidota bacterium]